MNEDMQSKIAVKVAQTLIAASTKFQPDQLKAYQDAIDREENPQARWVLEKIIENAEVGSANNLPLCDDTGIPHLFLEIGDQTIIPAGFFKAMQNGIALGLEKLPGRSMAVKGSDLERITQSGGLYDQPGHLLPAPMLVKGEKGSDIKLTVLMLGGGPEIRGKTLRVFHKHSLDVVLKEMVDWAVEGTALLGCLPAVLFFGVGRTNFEAAALSIEAMVTADFSRQNELEQHISNAANKSKIGALGVGGNHTVLRTFIKIGEQRASGVRIVSLRVGCCFDPRRASISWPRFDIENN